MRGTSKTPLALILLVCLHHSLFAQQSMFDMGSPIVSQVKSSLETLERIPLSESLTAGDILSIYKAEVTVSRCVWKGTPGMQSPEGVEPPINSWYGDSTLGSECLMHVQRHLNRFRVVEDGWKGEYNFMEPGRYWDSLAQRLYPNSPEASEISFDLDFKDMIRAFDIDLGSAGKTCEEHCRDVLHDRTEMYLEAYTQQEIDTWPAECTAARERFEKERSALLRKHGNAPFTKLLRDIDITTIIVYHSVC